MHLTHAYEAQGGGFAALAGQYRAFAKKMYLVLNGEMHGFYGRYEG